MRIEPRSGVAFLMKKGQVLSVMDPLGEQVADLVAFSQQDTREVISSGRSLDYASKLFLTTGDWIYFLGAGDILLDLLDELVLRFIEKNIIGPPVD